MAHSSTHRRHLFWLALGTATMALAMAVLLVFELMQRQSVQNSISLRGDSITPIASECEREYLRFRHELYSAVHARTPPDPQTLALRYDLFLSRLTLLRDSPSILPLVDLPEYIAVVPKLEQLARRADPVIGRTPHNPKELAELLGQVDALAAEVHALTLASNSFSGHLMESQARTVLAQTNQIVGLTLAQLILLLAAATALFIRQRRQEQERLERERVTQDLRDANLLAQAAMDKLRQSQEELARSETKAALNTVIAGVSHELSTPLGNSLMTASTLVDQGRDFQRTLDRQQALKRSELSAFVNSVCEGNDLLLRNLQRATELLKNFRQVANDQASGQRRVFALGKAVQEIVDTLAPSLKRHPHKIVVDIPDGIVMDSLPGPLGQIVINLVNNAYLHAFEGRSNGVLTIRASQAGDRVSLVFSDNGVGMSATTLSRLFHPFYSTKVGEGGTGLGMTIVADLVRKTLGGAIQVQSTPDVGTSIQLDLPQVAPKSEAAAPTRPSSATP